MLRHCLVTSKQTKNLCAALGLGTLSGCPNCGKTRGTPPRIASGGSIAQVDRTQCEQSDAVIAFLPSNSAPGDTKIPGQHCDDLVEGQFPPTLVKCRSVPSGVL